MNILISFVNLTVPTQSTERSDKKSGNALIMFQTVVCVKAIA